MTLSALVKRLPARPLLGTVLLAYLVYQAGVLLSHYRLPGWWFYWVSVAGFGLFALAILLAVTRAATLALPASLGRVGAHADRFVLLLALNLVIVSALSPVLRMLAHAPGFAPITHGVMAVAGALAAHVLFVVFATGVVALVWVLLLRLLAATVGRGAPVLALGRAVERVLVGLLILFWAGSLLIAVNGALDRSRPEHRRAEVGAVGAFELPFDFGGIAWVELRGSPGPGRTERMLLIPGRDQIWPQYVAPGQAVLVELHAGLLGIPWVHGIRIDDDLLAARVLAAVPTAAAFRKTTMSALWRDQKWAELRAHAEAHLRAYPNDRDYVLQMVQALDRVGQAAEAAALRAAVPP